MRYLSVCSGIEAATVAWHPLGWTPVGFSDIEPFPSAVLAHHYPNVPNFGDMKNYANWKIEEKVDLLVGGTPCQSFSVAGLRKGLSDPRGGLMLTYLEIAQRFSPEWIVWENVPGVLSANGGRAFGSFLGALGELGYGWAYRVMDAQWVRTHGHPLAVPQRRRRVFVVGYRGDFTRPAKVLFESQSLQRHSRSGEKEGKDIALHSQGSTGNGCWWDGSDCAGTLTKKNAGGDQRMPDKDNFGAILQDVDVAKCLAARSGTRNREDGDTYIPVPYDLFQITAPLNGQRRNPGDPCHTLARDNASHAAIVNGTKVVRRLTPLECERLQGFPSVRERIIINMCIDHQNLSVNVDAGCLRWQNNASVADAQKSPPNVNGAITFFSTNQADQNPLVALNVQLNSEEKIQEIHNHGKLIWSAKNVEISKKYHLPMSIENIAAKIVPIAQELAVHLRRGKVESHQNIKLSIPANSGEKNVLKSGKEIEEYVTNVGNDAKKEKFTTYALGALIPTYDSQTATLLCSVLNVISGCIPKTTLAENFSLVIDLETPYTMIPWRGKAECPDGHRYKALGNSMAVNCMEWIGERINACNA